MTKYYCKCGREIGRLVVYWQDSFSGYPSIAVYLYCEDCADKHTQTEPFEGSHINIPVFISASTKDKAASQIVSQYLKSDCEHFYIKSNVRQALRDVSKKNEK